MSVQQQIVSLCWSCSNFFCLIATYTDILYLITVRLFYNAHAVSHHMGLHIFCLCYRLDTSSGTNRKYKCNKSSCQDLLKKKVNMLHDFPRLSQLKGVKGWEVMQTSTTKAARDSMFCWRTLQQSEWPSGWRQPPKSTCHPVAPFFV